MDPQLEMNAVTNGINGSATVTDDSDFEENQSSIDGNIHSLVQWLNAIVPHLNLPLEASEEDLRRALIDGTALCSIINRLSPGLIEMRGISRPGPENVKKFLAAMDEMGLPRFVLADIEQGYMVPVLQCLVTLKAHFEHNIGKESTYDPSGRRWNLPEVEFSEGSGRFRGDAPTYKENSLLHGVEGQRNSVDGKHQHISHGFVGADFTLTELMKSNGLDNASTRALFALVNRILDETAERKNANLHHVASILSKLMNVIEHRVSTQADNLIEQNNLHKVRMSKLQSRIRVLETIASGTTEEMQILLSQLQHIKSEKIKIEEKEKIEKHDIFRIKEEKNLTELENSALRHELQMAKKMQEEHTLLLEEQHLETKVELEKRLKELECFLTESRNRVKELESFSDSKSQRWKKKEETYQSFIDRQYKAIQELRQASESLKHEVLKTKRSYSEECYFIGVKLKGLTEAAENYHSVLAENRRLYNEVQDLKGNIRVYCRIKPFLSGQDKKKSTLEYIGENGELVISNPLKVGKDSHRLFKFNKVFGPSASQEEVFLDTQPLIRSVLDGYNVCIFAYGQTGSGKTYTMSGPNMASEENWGVNYRAVHDLFQISRKRKCSIIYEIGVQMVEIYNEQVPQPNGLAVPDASMYAVASTADVLELMRIGSMNRAVGATALNERSSRSHSVLTVHVRGTDSKTGAVLRGNLHLVDLAGSERVDRSEVSGDRLREAQHINKSLSALGDVIFALAQKSPHVPYRNSKLTQVLQSSLGGHAKTLMFVQLNPDADSYSETASTLKFAERVSGVELGAAKSNREGKGVRELTEQVAFLKDQIAKKDREIEHLQVLKDNAACGKCAKNSPPGSGSFPPRRYSIGSPRLLLGRSGGKSPRFIARPASDMDNSSDYGGKRSEAGSLMSMDDVRNHKAHRRSKSMAECSLQNESGPERKLSGTDVGQDSSEDAELLGFGGADSDERLSDISDGVLSMGGETESSMASAAELMLFADPGTPTRAGKPEEVTSPKYVAKPAEATTSREAAKPVYRPVKTNIASKLPKPSVSKLHQTRLARLSLNKNSPKATPGPPSAKKPPPTTSVSPTAKTSKRWQ
ncbi:hypothetical protein Tsubulata_015484 [Turnera subulata]|uniref:Kinesin motor domain-containing protein n=1 Tax=Turnera subulata TaxID=218843 RepID=A0A9Q0FQ30_9ROSI|nr:hypothetical protein Tsubulata_015484 [Turnera subulata]